MPDALIASVKQNRDFGIADFYLDDYLSQGSVQRAAQLTNEIYAHSPNRKILEYYSYKEIEVPWAWYDLVYKHTLTFTCLEEFCGKLQAYDRIELHDIHSKHASVLCLYFGSKVIVKKGQSERKQIPILHRALAIAVSLVRTAIVVLHTLLSCLVISIFRRRSVGIWIGDFIFQGTDSDFRISELYRQMRFNHIKFVEFVRFKDFSIFRKHWWIRKRPTVYYEILLAPFYFLFRRHRGPEGSDFYGRVLASFNYQSQVLKTSLPFFVNLLRFLGVRAIFSFNLTSRNAHVALAAKLAGIKTVGIMHGVCVRTYNVTEFMEPYTSPHMIGPDFFGVWSDWQQELYRKYCRIVPPDQIEVSGLLRPVQLELGLKQKPYSLVRGPKVRVLIISEPLVDPKEFINQFSALLDNSDFEVAVKTRPMIVDPYVIKLKKYLPRFEQLEFLSDRLENVARDFDVFVGSHSTAVLEASLFGKLTVLLESKKWGDYFEVSSVLPEVKMPIPKTELLTRHIQDRILNERQLNSVTRIREAYFGRVEDGCAWMIDKVTGVP
jgi:hypothetical protein